MLPEPEDFSLKKVKKKSDWLNSFWVLTTPFWTENPNWYFVSGLFILTSTTGAQDTAVSFTAVLFLVFWKLHKKIHYYIQNYLDLIQCHLHFRKCYIGKFWTQKQCQIYWQDFWTFFQVSTQCLTHLNWFKISKLRANIFAQTFDKKWTYLDISLASGQRKANQRDPIYCNDLNWEAKKNI